MRTFVNILPARTHTHANTHTRTRTAHTHTHTRTRTHTHAHTHTHTHTHAHTHTHIHTHTYTHTYTHTIAHRAKLEHSHYVELLHSLVPNMVTLPADHACPDCCFVEDVLVCVCVCACVCVCVRAPVCVYIIVCANIRPYIHLPFVTHAPNEASLLVLFYPRVLLRQSAAPRACSLSWDRENVYIPEKNHILGDFPAGGTVYTLCCRFTIHIML